MQTPTPSGVGVCLLDGGMGCSSGRHCCAQHVETVRLDADAVERLRDVVEVDAAQRHGCDVLESERSMDRPGPACAQCLEFELWPAGGQLTVVGVHPPGVVAFDLRRDTPEGAEEPGDLREVLREVVRVQHDLALIVAVA